MRVGRPKLSAERKKSTHIVVRLSPGEREAVEGAAAAQGRLAGVWAREVLLTAAAAINTGAMQPAEEGAAEGERERDHGDEPPASAPTT